MLASPMTTHANHAIPSMADVLGIAGVERRALVEHGLRELSAGRVREAIETLRVATTLDPLDKRGLMALSRAYLANGESLKAEAVREWAEESER